VRWYTYSSLAAQELQGDADGGALLNDHLPSVRLNCAGRSHNPVVLMCMQQQPHLLGLLALPQTAALRT
jgi:hypothetical protein